MSGASEADQGENDEIDVVSMDTKSPGTREEAAKSPEEDIVLEAMVDDDGEDDEESHVTITHEEEEGVKEENVDVEEEDEAEGAQCYCEGKGEGPMLPCEKCKKSFHLACFSTGNPTTLEGDTFFKLNCSACNIPEDETVERLRLTWQQVVMLSLYNLGRIRSGRRGFFRWKEDICEFISLHWNLIFGAHKIKTTTWHGTVAGVLSVGNKQLFRSGAMEFNETGWWTLIENRPPTLKQEPSLKAKQFAGRKARAVFEPTIKVEGLRNRKRGTSAESAIELKEKRSRTQEAKDIRKAKQASEEEYKKKQQKDSKDDESSLDSFTGSENLGQPTAVPDSPSILSLLGGDNSSDSFTSNLLNESDLTPEVNLPSMLMAGDEEEVLHHGGSKGLSDLSALPSPIIVSRQFSNDSSQDTPMEAISEMPSFAGSLRSLDSSANSVSGKETKLRKHKVKGQAEMKTKDGAEEDEEDAFKPKFLPMSVYEERQLLKLLESCSEAVDVDPVARRLRRKLLIRQEKRARGQPLFDLDASLQQMLQRRCHMTPSKMARSVFTQSPRRGGVNPQGVGMQYVSSSQQEGDYRILDRFQMSHYSAPSVHQPQTSFKARLIGCNESAMMQSIVSPYTARVLKPFIRRDTESKPLKLRLLQEILEHHRKAEPSFKAPPVAPIDYCYVRPQHIPSINALCREFFWPGIDLSECLHYPDFSVVVLYRKVVIGFGFMVPDVKYNEAYISFLFVHPEWRSAGIGTFMVYHLIQTCMGKDVTLHVSASNPAMLLYQKFGFKQEELFLDFYDKYYPEDSQECRHAFF
ncbi:cysteine-rich protein 2-binding protein [Strongylocentrotus purpuratus]|uniref:N-acetyltransferase domain-containing protein n=1 Tax=Strongylocentrotus purpuratus TaxID=7668 RepID=A0A7M7MY64_STRPU|nr:cysteine-rich protein 2-binding protein [Strongylocentrotus purpuratus]